MPSSLIFAGLAVAWLVVLVPMVAKRRQEVARTAESALAARVLRRKDPARAVADHGEEVPVMTEPTGLQELEADGVEDERGGRRREREYRPGRGGYDPEAAALSARAKYAFRQRVVAGLLICIVGSVVLALTYSAQAWWGLGGSVVALAGYLGYLRRQVRIEEEVRRRRSERLAGGRTRSSAVRFEPLHDDEFEGGYEGGHEADDDPDGYDEAADRHEADRDADRRADRADAEPARARATPPAVVVPAGAVAVDLDDEDPVFDELDEEFEPPYRRAVGE